MRGFTQTQLPTRDNRAKFGVSNVAKEGAAVGVEDEVLAQVAAVCNDANPVSWLVAGDSIPHSPHHCFLKQLTFFIKKIKTSIKVTMFESQEFI